MASDQGPVVSSALLRGELVRLRRDHDLTQEQVASELEWSPSKLIRIEGGRSAITKVDLDALLTKYEVVSERDRGRMQALSRQSRERAWWDQFRGILDGTYVTYVGYEAGAASMRQFQGSFVPGLLQTGPYAHELSVATVDDPAVRDAAVRMRLMRQSEMAKRATQPRLSFVLDEAVIRRQVGVEADPEIMPAQLREIVARIGANGQLTVRIIPFRAGAHAGMTGPFTLLQFDGDLPDFLYLDAGKGVFSMNSGDAVADYVEAFEGLVAGALSASDSVELMLAAADEMS